MVWLHVLLFCSSETCFFDSLRSVSPIAVILRRAALLTRQYL
jgi:hypothetical protein